MTSQDKIGGIYVVDHPTIKWLNQWAVTNGITIHTKKQKRSYS